MIDKTSDMSILAVDDLNAPTLAVREAQPVRRVKYQRLSMIDRAHAESLARSCRLSPAAKEVSRVLAHSSLVQSLRTTVPLLAADFFTLWLLMFATTTVVERVFGLPNGLVTRYTALTASLLLIPITHLAGLYPAFGTSAAVEFRQLVKSAGISLCIFTGIGVVANSENWPYFAVSSFLAFILAIPVLPTARYSVRCLASRYLWWGAPVLIYANADIAKELFLRIKLIQDRGLRPVGVLLSTAEYWSQSDIFEKAGIPAFDIRNALECALKLNVTWILIGTETNPGSDSWDEDSESDAEINAIPNRVVLSSSEFDCGMWDQAHTIGPVCGLWLSNSRHCGSRAFLKRFVDVIVSFTAIILGSPILLAFAAAIRLSSPGPIFYAQKRIGKGGRFFNAWKFRTMRPDASQILEMYLAQNPELRREWNETRKLKNDPRVTWIGQYLRPTSLDELPQLWNILWGEMSLVGPRPIVNEPTYDAEYVNDYPNEFAAYTSMRPGLTGLWQVTCRNSGVYELRIYWDMYYIRNWSLWIDLYIILRTFRTVLLREGTS